MPDIRFVSVSSATAPCRPDTLPPTPTWPPTLPAPSLASGKVNYQGGAKMSKKGLNMEITDYRLPLTCDPLLSPWFNLSFTRAAGFNTCFETPVWKETSRLPGWLCMAAT